MSNNQSSDTVLWQGAIIPASITALLSLIVMATLKGKSGAVGAILASVTVIIFFSIHLLVARISRNLDPMITMALAMFSYFAKVVFMGIFLLLVTRFTDRSTVDRASFAIGPILTTVSWLSGEVGSFVKLRVQLPLPKKEGDIL